MARRWLSPPKGKGGALPLQIGDQLLRKAALIGCGSSASGQELVLHSQEPKAKIAEAKLPPFIKALVYILGLLAHRQIRFPYKPRGAAFSRALLVTNTREIAFDNGPGAGQIAWGRDPQNLDKHERRRKWALDNGNWLCIILLEELQ